MNTPVNNTAVISAALFHIYFLYEPPQKTQTKSQFSPQYAAALVLVIANAHVDSQEFSNQALLNICGFGFETLCMFKAEGAASAQALANL